MAFSDVVSRLIIEAVDRTANETKAVEARLRGLEKTARLAAGALATIGVSLGAREIVQAADNYKLYQNRIRLVTEDAKDFAETQQDLIDLARDTRSQLGATIELYSRVARSTQDLNLTQERRLELTRLVNEALQIGGATQAEAAGGVVQFSQALQLGVLRGQELRSVMQGMPRLAEAIAEGLGKQQGELLKLGEKGKLAAGLILEAIHSQAQALDTEFSKVQGTVGQAVDTLADSATVFVGKLDVATGASDRLTSKVYDLADALDYLSQHLPGAAEGGNQVTATYDRVYQTIVKLAPILGVLQGDFGALFGQEEEARQGLEALYQAFEEGGVATTAFKQGIEQIFSAFLEQLGQATQQTDELEQKLEKIHAPFAPLPTQVLVPRVGLTDAQIREIELRQRQAAERAMAASRQVLVAGLQDELSVRADYGRLTESQEVELTTRLATYQREATLDEYHATLQDLVSLRRQNYLSEQEFADRVVELNRQTQERISGITRDGLTQRERFEQLSSQKKLQWVANDLAYLTASTANTNRTLFRLNKIAALSNATVYVGEAVARALHAADPPYNFILAAAVAAAGAAQLHAIRTASFGSTATTPSLIGSSGYVGGQAVPLTTPTFGSQTGSAERAAPRIEVNIFGSVYGEGGRRALAQEITDLLREHVEVTDDIIITDRSRNAANLGGGG